MRVPTKQFVTVLFVLLAVVAASREAEACTCVRPDCGNLLSADTVFEATVASIHDEPGVAGSARAASATVFAGAGMRRVVLKDVKGWRGEAPTVIFTGRGGGDCGFPFVAGERYLVEAHRSADGRVSAGICNMIRPVKYAQQLLAFLQASKENPNQTRVWGTVARITGWQRSPDAFTPVKGALVTLAGAKEVTISTDADGHFVVTDLPRGTYSVTAEVDGKTVPPERNWSEFLLGRDGVPCEELAINVPANGGLRGSVLDEAGAPIKNVFVYLLSADHTDPAGDRPGLGLTLPEGTFELDDLPPGRYVLAMNSRLGPSPGAPYRENETPPVTVADGQTATAVLRVQRATKVTVRGVVRDAAGAPVPGAQVDYWVQLNNGHRSTSWPHPKTDDRGSFSVELWKDYRYVITVGPERDPWARVEFVADGEPILIVARPR